jgi:hypothetical protein
MKKSLIINALIIFLLLIPAALEAQNTLKARVFGNSSRFLGEPRGEEVIYPMIDNLMDPELNYTDFTNQSGLGLGAEIMLSLSSKAWVGFELSSSNMKGYNNLPPLYNFLFTTYNQLNVNVIDIDLDVPVTEVQLPLSYNTSLINLLANFRFYLVSEGRFLPFIKIHSGISLIGSELMLKNASDWPPAGYTLNVNGVDQEAENLDFGLPVLFSQGTSTSPEGRVAALNLGGGAGFEVPISEKFSFYADYTYSMINSDIVDGRPNIDYIETSSLPLKRFNTMGNVGRFSFGLCYTIGDSFNIIGGSGGGGKGGSKTGRQHPYLPFYELKRPR